MSSALSRCTNAWKVVAPVSSVTQFAGASSSNSTYVVADVTLNVVSFPSYGAVTVTRNP